MAPGILNAALGKIQNRRVKRKENLVYAPGLCIISLVVHNFRQTQAVIKEDFPYVVFIWTKTSKQTVASAFRDIWGCPCLGLKNDARGLPGHNQEAPDQLLNN